MDDKDLDVVGSISRIAKSIRAEGGLDSDLWFDAVKAIQDWPSFDMYLASLGTSVNEKDARDDYLEVI